MKFNFCREYRIQTELVHQARFFLFRVIVSDVVDPQTGMSFDLNTLDASVVRFQKKIETQVFESENQIFSAYLASVGFLDQVERLELEDPTSNLAWIWKRKSGKISYQLTRFLVSKEFGQKRMKQLKLVAEEQNTIEFFKTQFEYAYFEKLAQDLNDCSPRNAAVQNLLREPDVHLSLSEIDPITRTQRVIEI